MKMKSNGIWKMHNNGGRGILIDVPYYSTLACLYDQERYMDCRIATKV